MLIATITSNIKDYFLAAAKSLLCLLSYTLLLIGAIVVLLLTIPLVAIGMLLDPVEDGINAFIQEQLQTHDTNNTSN